MGVNWHFNASLAQNGCSPLLKEWRTPVLRQTKETCGFRWSVNNLGLFESLKYIFFYCIKRLVRSPFLGACITQYT